MHLLRFACYLMTFIPIVAHNAAATTTVYVNAPTPTTYTIDSAFKAAMLRSHNFYRDQHGVPALTWNNTSASFASRWARNCVFAHSVSSFSFSLFLSS